MASTSWDCFEENCNNEVKHLTCSVHRERSTHVSSLTETSPWPSEVVSFPTVRGVGGWEVRRGPVYYPGPHCLISPAPKGEAGRS